LERDPGVRQAFIQEACGGDELLAGRVEALLRAHSQPNSLLDAPHLVATIDTGPPAKPGTQIGPYILRELLGEGGFGVVYLAEQEQPVRRRVALKIIKPGMDTRQVIARFEAERQALAMMDHPNIAKVLDAGMVGAASRAAHDAIPDDEPNSPARLAGPTGRPYFVMELVQGVPITEYCDQCNLSTHERLKLFVTVCHAVQHAHQKGIIHRDLKPTNVLVAMQDGQPAPKIIDFGVAKAIDQQLTEHTLTTAFAPMVGTPLYMSPEQAELSPLGVDTRSDIYSLGVMLYELLTGATPFDKDRLHSVSYDELRRIIREEDPPRPSARISTLAADLATTVAERRRTDARRLRQQVRGELDWIVMKCLEKDRNRRYESPASLARDIERYLHDEPVQACPPSASYRFRKYAMRNKTFLGAGGAIAAAIVVGLGLATWQNFRARTESARAQAVSDLLQEMLSSADAARAKGADYKVRELLDDFSSGLGGQLTGQPEVESDIRATIGRAYRSLKLPEKAQPHFEKAVELRRRSDGPHSEKLAAVLVDGGWNLLDQQRRDEAESQLHEALAIYRSRGVTGAPLFHALEILQHILRGSAGREEDAERVTQEALEVARRSGQEFPDQANLLHRYADLKISQGKFVEAEQLARQAVDMHHRLHGDRHPETAFGLKTLARALESQQKLADAEKAIRDALLVFRRQFPEDHPNIRDTNYQLRSVIEARGDKSALNVLTKDEAEQAVRSYTPTYRVHLAELLLANRKPTDAQKEEARRHIRQAIRENSQVLVDYPDDFYRRRIALDGFALAISPCAAKGFADVVDELNDRLKVELPKLLADFDNSSDSQWWAAVVYRNWGARLYGYGKYVPTADRAFGEAKDVLEKLSVSDPNRYAIWLQLADTYCWLGECQWRLDKREDAATSFRRAMDLYDERAAEIAAPIEAPINIVWDKIYMAYYLVATQREGEATELAREAADAAKLVTDPAGSAQAHHVLALLQARLGDFTGYREACKALLDVDFASASDVTKVQTILAWILAPDALADMSLVVKRAEEYAAYNSLGLPHIDLFQWGASHLRAGQYDRAAELLEQSIDVYPSDPPPPPGALSINYQRLLLAMTKWRQGQHDEARQLLAEAQAAIDDELKPPSPLFELRMTTEALLREAEELIEPKEANEAVESKTSTSGEPKQ
jgi:serine/threonine protein kinase/Tfp pilus assembly protein PilF